MGFTNVIKSECILVEVKNIPLSMLQKTSTHTQTTTTVSGVSRHASSSCCREIVHLGLFQQEDLQRCDGKFQSCSHQEKVAKPSGYDQTKKSNMDSTHQKTRIISNSVENITSSPFGHVDFNLFSELDPT